MELFSTLHWFYVLGGYNCYAYSFCHNIRSGEQNTMDKAVYEAVGYHVTNQLYFNICANVSGQYAIVYQVSNQSSS